MTYSNEYIKLQHQLHVNLARGHLNIARGSRSSLGGMPGKVAKTKHIFNKEMTAIYTLTPNPNQTVFHLKRNKSVKNEQANAAPPSSSSLRQRKTTTTHNDETKDSIESNESELVDPLSWFGSMVPRPMVMAQSDFQNGLNMVVEMANIKQRLDVLSKKWDKLG
mmetsp:Transcript_8274/g.12823  ORF Transcript_8274/g.12823 Transcript_8274/m.12823 type:complete len:164 (+) Transcript_8274:122-613(+)|eukprot:CAMPEP_0202709602 /NCGR_PEP_ID=MMETSP1385-20130828/21696_1 /ASSEMBLY_ACC=CAM_ASM_000861 /TAXON_ID=933848 /ORGANISM="Elphidium margaritaceum" /LENGTH=163 /DNA_ID=CAMNT_0049368899 /DNA_START=66 /DNA_END=557 /DNA_ORIENTATION=-